jgi:flagellar biosynthetic protein FlhB
MPDQEKTEQPTDKRRGETRQKGKVAKSREVSTYIVLMGGLVVLYFAGSYMATEMTLLLKSSILHAGDAQITAANVPSIILRNLIVMVKLMAPFLIVVYAAAVLGNVIQFGFLFSWEPIMPKLNKLNPIQGMGRFFSLRSLTEIIKFFVKVLPVGFIVYRAIKKEFPFIMPLADQSVLEIGAYMGKTAIRIMLRSSWVLLVLAILDYAYQRWEHQKGLKMTKHEVKDEMKQQEGDPQVKGRIRRVQREWARRRMMEAVPKADVVITNPVQLAIAISYNSETMAAPEVVAKGADIVADRIRQIARSHGIPVVENKPLARALFREVEIGKRIPVALYKAVAEVLAYVYRLKNRI